MKRTRLFFLAALLLFTATSTAQNSRQVIKDAIANKGECRNVAITATGGDLMLYGRNGYASSGCPSSLTDKLYKLNEDDDYIDDVQLTEDGSWLVLYNDNDAAWYGIPYSLEQKILEFHNEGEIINTITFNDEGDWIVISDAMYSASSDDLLEFLEEGESEYGELWTAHLTNNCLVVVYERGYKWIGDIPASLKEAATSVTFNVYRLKFAGTSWFMADKEGHFRYFM